jgi:hypothetical protein
MIAYEKDKHELMLVNLYVQELLPKPVEFANLFHTSLRSLTGLLHWAANTVKMAFDFDAQGIWIATWVEPSMSGAYWGLWVREDKRKSKAMLAFVNQSLDLCLKMYPVLMAPTKQVRLRSEMERLGWIYQGEIPHLFDGAPAGVYYMDQETRDARFERRREIIEQFKHLKQPVRAIPGGDRGAGVAGGEANGSTNGVANGGSAPNGRGKLKSPGRKRRNRRGARAVEPRHDQTETAAGGIGAGGQLVRPADSSGESGEHWTDDFPDSIERDE